VPSWSDSTLAISDAEADAAFASLAHEKALVLAVSGGPDSTSLLWLAANWRRRRRRGPSLLAVTVDHGLRPESAREASAVKRFARTLGIPHRTLRWRGDKPTSAVEERARNERYRLLGTAARRIGARCIVTAHTLDDQAETVLIRMARGSGLTGLAAMAAATPVDGLFVVRPLLEVAKTRLIATLAAADIPYAEDASNCDPRFTRARIRALMPTFQAEGLTPRRLGILARRLRRADTALDAIAREVGARLAGGQWPQLFPVVLDRDGLAGLPDELALRIVGRAVAQAGDEGPVELAKLEALMGAVRAALSASGRLRRTLAGAVVTVAGAVTIDRAPPRRYPGSRGKVTLPKSPASK
jgi:tRNA(Ile)-lysidine synthase